MYLFIDTETTGLPRSFSAPPQDTDNWPRLVTVSWIACDRNRKRMSMRDFIVRPSGFVIPPEAARVHGVSTSQAVQNGQQLEVVLALLLFDLERCGVHYVVAHNWNFDRSVIDSEFCRCAFDLSPFAALQGLCTMQVGTDLCRLPGRQGSYKWPKLTELHTALFGTGFDGEHSSMSDVEACMRCFFELLDRKLISLETGEARAI